MMMQAQFSKSTLPQAKAPVANALPALPCRRPAARRVQKQQAAAGLLVTAQKGQRQAIVARATEEATEAPLTNTQQQQQQSQPSGVRQPDWVPVCPPEDIPKGVRKEVEVDGRQVLLFWYRNMLYCIQARSPAEGAYSEGFIKAKFTQDYCIECPTTGSLFSLNDGSIKAWYPNNTVLRLLTPPSGKMEIYPVKLQQDAIYVDVSMAGRQASATKGGSNTSAENNNVFAVQPTVYFEGMDPAQERASPLMVPKEEQGTNPAVIILAIALVAATGTIGWAVYKFIQLN